ncbi:MAG: phosphate ABC transporter permease subunit PstC [Peptococcaceae bacterium]|nr:MAG: phosphate ABC transporter permease subunit PstC [Peptococcaceae bacterium]
MALIIWEVGRAAWLSIHTFGFSFFTSSRWDPVHDVFGALPFIYGTLASSLLALIIAVPLSLGIAIFLSEMAPPWLKDPVSFVVEILAAIPSVVYGLWGIFVLAPWLRDGVEDWLAGALGFLPFFQGPRSGIGLLTAGIILAIMILPTITAISREVLVAVPQSQREAMLALGGTRWETIVRVVLPYGRVGLFGAIMLGLGRAVGETMAVTMVIGNQPNISLSLFSPAYTMPSVIVNEFSEAVTALHLSALMEIGLILFAITLLLNIMALILVRRIGAVPVRGGRM